MCDTQLLFRSPRRTRETPGGSKDDLRDPGDTPVTCRTRPPAWSDTPATRCTRPPAWSDTPATRRTRPPAWSDTPVTGRTRPPAWSDAPATGHTRPPAWSDAPATGRTVTPPSSRASSCGPRPQTARPFLRRGGEPRSVPGPGRAVAGPGPGSARGHVFPSIQDIDRHPGGVRPRWTDAPLGSSFAGSRTATSGVRPQCREAVASRGHA